MSESRMVGLPLIPAMRLLLNGARGNYESMHAARMRFSASADQYLQSRRMKTEE